MLERERRSPELSPAERIRQFTPEVSARILGNKFGSQEKNGNPIQGKDVPPQVQEALHLGSVAKRGEYWDQQSERSFGQQMVKWLRDEKSGIAKYIENGRGDSELKPFLDQILAQIQMQGTDFEGNTRQLLESINNDLDVGEKLLADKLSPDERSALLIYNNWFINSGDEEHMQDNFNNLTDLITTYVIGTNSSQEDAEKRLAQVYPFLHVFGGGNADDAIAATIRARVDVAFGVSLPSSGEISTALGRDVIQFIGKYHPNQDQSEPSRTDSAVSISDESSDENLPPVETLESGKKYSVEEIFAKGGNIPATNLGPDGRTNPYWINGAVPRLDSVLKQITEDGAIDSYTKAKPFWIYNTDGTSSSTDFPPAHVFNPDIYNKWAFARYEALTEEDSGLLALAGVAVKPEQRATFYKLLAGIILRVHTEDNSLLKQFLDAQMQTQTITKDGQSFPVKTIDEFMVYEMQRAQQKGVANIPEYLKQPLPIESDRLLVFDPTIVQVNGQNVPWEMLNEPLTIKGWQERFKSLQDSINTDSVTLEQLRQIEFLSHAIDFDKLMPLLQTLAV